MRGSIRNWMVVGALASAALVFPGCRSTQQDTGSEVQEQTGTRGARAGRAT